MSELATKEAFAKAGNTRHAEVSIEGLGRVKLRSLKTSESSKVDALQARAAVALSSGKAAEGERLLTQAAIKRIMLCVLADDGSLMFTSDDKELLQNLDSGVMAALDRACAEHCQVESIDLEELGKNSSVIPAE